MTLNAPLRFVTYNVQYCTGLDGRTDIDRIAAEVDGADVICLQEVERHWQRTGQVDQVAEIAARFPRHHHGFGPAIDLDADSVAADGRVRHRRRQFGNMVLARWPILTLRNHLLPKLHLRHPMSLQRAALEAIVALPDGPCRVISVHLAHAAGSERLLQAERLLWLLSHAARDGGAISGTALPPGWADDGPPLPDAERTVLMGDFNMLPGSPEHALLCGPVEPGHGPLSTRDGLVDAWLATGGDPAAGFTWGKAPDRRRLDYAFVAGPLVERLRGVRVDEAATGSDHLPLWVEFA